MYKSGIYNALETIKRMNERQLTYFIVNLTGKIYVEDFEYLQETAIRFAKQRFLNRS
jgi:hypothetical protein